MKLADCSQQQTQKANYSSKVKNARGKSSRKTHSVGQNSSCGTINSTRSQHAAKRGELDQK